MTEERLTEQFRDLFDGSKREHVDIPDMVHLAKRYGQELAVAELENIVEEGKIYRFINSQREEWIESSFYKDTMINILQAIAALKGEK